MQHSLRSSNPDDAVRDQPAADGGGSLCFKPTCWSGEFLSLQVHQASRLMAQNQELRESLRAVKMQNQGNEAEYWTCVELGLLACNATL
jgi:hypothetical protein